VRLAFLTCLSDAGFDPVAQNVALKIGEDRKHPCQSAAAGRGKVERLAQRDEPDAQ